VARREAFTLMELLLALAVSAVVLSVISTVFFNALNLRNRSAASYDEILPLQHTVAVLKRDLAGVLPPGGTLTGELQSTPTTGDATLVNPFAGGQQVGPFLYTATGNLDEFSPFADVQRVSYYLVPPTNDYARGRDLMRVVSGNLLPATVDEAVPRFLMGGVEEMYFQYHDGTAWLDTWDTTVSTNLPAAVKVQLELAVEDDARRNPYQQEPVEIIVPLLVQPRTQTAATPGGGE
jgi:type II secretion system protein J